jgi:hypothetical protein
MVQERFGTEKVSAIGMYIRSTSDITLKWNDMRSIADITKLDEICFVSHSFLACEPAFSLR